MAQASTTKRTATAKPAATRKRAPALAQASTTKRTATARPEATRKRAPARRPAAAVDRSEKLSKEVLASVEAGQRAAIEAVRKFIDTVDRSLPGSAEHPSWRQDVVDSAMEMADRLVHAQYDFIRKVIDSAGKTLSRPDGGKSGPAK